MSDLPASPAAPPSGVLYEALNTSVLRAVQARRARRMLDLGCGDGSLGFALKQVQEIRVTGITYSPREAEIARTRLDEVLVADLDTFHPETALGKFDVIVCSHVLEHLREPARLLRALQPHLADGGVAIVALPNILQWSRRLRFLAGDFTYTQGGLMDTTHLRFYTWETAQELLREASYEILDCSPDGHFPQPLLRSILPARVTAGIDRWTAARFPGLFATQILLTARPRT